MNRLALALLLLVVPILGAAQTDTPAPRPYVEVGDRWTYRGTNVLGPDTDEHETVIHRADGKILHVVSTRKSDGREFDSIWTAEWNAMASYTGIIYRPNSGIYSFPMRPGDRRTIDFQVMRPRTNIIMFHAKMDVTVVGWETVEVPAGKFRALKVTAEGVWQQANGSGAHVQQITHWYSPEVKRWVKFEGINPKSSLSEELISYKLNE